MVEEVGDGSNGKINKGQVVRAWEKIFGAMRSGKPVDGVRAGPSPPPDTELPNDNFIEGWSAERLLRHLVGQDAKPHEVTALGPYIEAAKTKAQDDENVLRLSGKQHVVAFPESLVLLFASLDQDRIDALGKVADWTPEIVSTLHKLAQREIERVLKRQMWGRAWKATGAGAVLAFGVAKWGWEIWVWVSTTFPSLVAEALPWLTGLAK